MMTRPAWRLAFGAMLLSFAPIMVRATESPPTTSAFYRMLFGGRWQIVIAIPAAFLGVAMIIGIDWTALTEGYRMGVVFGLATAVCYSSYLLIMRWIRVNERSGVTPMVEVAWTSLACAGVLAITSMATGESLAIVRGSEAVLLLGYALFAILGLVIISWSLDKVPTSLVGLLLLLEPTFAYVWDLTLYDRPVSSLEIGGALLALGAIYLGSMKWSG
jgi:drug/metabolite transporter (DMT)-like permease